MLFYPEKTTYQEGVSIKEQVIKKPLTYSAGDIMNRVSTESHI